MTDCSCATLQICSWRKGGRGKAQKGHQHASPAHTATRLPPACPVVLTEMSSVMSESQFCTPAQVKMEPVDMQGVNHQAMRCTCAGSCQARPCLMSFTPCPLSCTPCLMSVAPCHTLPHFLHTLPHVMRALPYAICTPCHVSAAPCPMLPAPPHSLYTPDSLFLDSSMSSIVDTFQLPMHRSSGTCTKAINGNQ